MFQKILIANRGEIAARIITTARRMGIATVAVYSDADAGAAHVTMADEAVRIGPASVAESYLNTVAILDAARRTGAQAIHPGYGFLSENPAFVDAVEAAGLVFIGPPASAIRAMGLKDAAKRLMEEAGVPVVPGYHGPDQDPGHLLREADAIGYPVLIKARAGGGGKGMRLVEDPAAFPAALEGAAREAQASFGDPACLIEKYVSSPRHIEVQILADAHGNIVHLYERDCSLQRRHQKVIEEAPAPGMTNAVRDAMTRAAIHAARRIGYRGAGTVEFIVDGSGPLREDGFWFMEMNTRLQVEHPVSEAITGFDLVELQLRIASGEPLPFAQDDIRLDGWAVEARLYAEDAERGFLPATGLITHLAFPPSTAFQLGPVRVDTGVRAGDRITPWYDPMIAKIIAHAPDRATAYERLTSTLEATRVSGCTTNLAFLAALSRHPEVRAGTADTGLIARDMKRLTGVTPPSPEATALAALATVSLLDPPSGSDPWSVLTGWRAWSHAENVVTLNHRDLPRTLRITHLGSQRFQVADGDRSSTLTVLQCTDDTVRFESDGLIRSAGLARTPEQVIVFLDGRQHAFRVPVTASDSGHSPADGTIVAPLPGLVTRVHAAPDTVVAKGTPLIILEAMKMEHLLTAPCDGRVAAILVGEGDQVGDGMVLLRIETGDG